MKDIIQQANYLILVEHIHTLLMVFRKMATKKFWWNFQGIVSFRDSLTHSRNLSTLNLVTDLGIGKVANELKDTGLKM